MKANAFHWLAHHGTFGNFPGGPFMRFGVFAAMLLILVVAHPTSASAERRVALVIGNSAYQNVPKLPNPVNDARAVAALLKNAGFDVIESRSDLGIANIRRAMRDFSNIARDADIGVVYYAGHGIEVDGTNYLIPVDAVLERDVDVDDETLSVDRVMKTLEAVKRLRLVILDACRDNPFTRSMKRTVVSRSVGRGLAKVEPITSDTLIAFAAKAGSTAMDGNGKNSPFTAALIKYLAIPGLDLRIAFGRVRDDVMKATANQQEPFVYGSLGGEVVSLVTAPESKVVAPTSTATDNVADARRDYYEFLNNGATKEAWGDFLQLHPTGPFANLAHAQLAKLIDAEKKAADEAKAAEKAAIEKAAAEGAAAEKKAVAEKAAAEKAEAERIAAEKRAAVERASAEKKAAAEREAAEKAVAEKAKAERIAAEKKTAAEQAAAQKAEAEKMATGTKTASVNPGASEKAITEQSADAKQRKETSKTQDKKAPKRTKLSRQHPEPDRTHLRRPNAAQSTGTRTSDQASKSHPTGSSIRKLAALSSSNRRTPRRPSFWECRQQRTTRCLTMYGTRN
jgi:uncharacterized caspase-like protein